MTDLQIGLLVIGAAAVAGVLVYNRLQERATRRQAERAFGSQHADVLLDAPPERREPTLDLCLSFEAWARYYNNLSCGRCASRRDRAHFIVRESVAYNEGQGIPSRAM